ncbi:MAG TPA: MFS transporter [Jatrophihabitans sp.]
MTHPVEQVTFHGLFRSRDFAVLYLAGTQSQLGDQLARVALSILVFTRTGSGLLTAATYALTYLPAVAGGVLLAGLADTRPRRGLLVACDLIRAGLFALMAINGMPLAVVCVLLVIAVLVGAPYNAAEPALVADIYSGARYQAAIGLRTATLQGAQLVGFAVGGVIVSLTGPHTALAIDAATFAASAVVLRALLHVFPPAAAGQNAIEQMRTGLRAVAADPRLRVLLGFAWLNAFWIVPEGLAAPYAAAHGGGPVAVGALLAAGPTGSLIGTVVMTRWLPAGSRSRLIGVFAFVCGLPLIACALGPPVWLAAVLWGTCGLFVAYLVLVIADFVAVVAAPVRGQAIGLAGSSLLAAQGIGLILGGVLASAGGSELAIAVAGAIGSLLAVPLALSRHRLTEGCQALA